MRTQRLRLSASSRCRSRASARRGTAAFPSSWLRNRPRKVAAKLIGQMSLRDQVHAQLPGVPADLKELVAIESVSADPSRAAEVERSAQRVEQLLVDTGCPDVRVIRANGGAPAVVGRF